MQPKMSKQANENQLNLNAKTFWPRRNAAAIAAVKVNDQIQNEYKALTIEWTLDLLWK